MPGQAKRTKEFALLKSITQRLAQASSFTPLLCWGRPAPRFSLISTLPLRPKDGEPLSLGTQLPSARLYRDHEFAKNRRGVFSLDDWSGSISRCVFLVNLLVLKAPVSRGMATLVVLVPSHGHPCLGDAEKQEFQMQAAAVCMTFRGAGSGSCWQCQERAEGTGAEGPRQAES